MRPATTSIREASGRGFDNPLLPCYKRTVTRELSAAAIKIIRDPRALFGTVEISRAFLHALRERLQTRPHTTPRSHR
jgi:hypothetical protein